MSDFNIRERLAENLAAVRAEIAVACAKAGRSPNEVRLVAVTKSVGPEVAALLPGLGVNDLAESRPQSLWSRAAELPTATWHMIGHLQRNKIERTLPVAALIHSVDSVRLATAIEEYAAERGQIARVLLEVHLTGEAAKYGIHPGELSQWAVLAQGWPHIRIEGLMGMAAQSDDPEAARPAFQKLHDLRAEVGPLFPESHDLRELSMGMSGDFAVAVEEGATMVRIGSRLFEGL